MKSKSKGIVGLPRVIVIGCVGAFIGAMIAGISNPLPLTRRTHLEPMIYRIPKIPGGTPLRMAMVHDILHERYLRHGQAWYAQRIKDARATLAQPNDPLSQAALDAMDDLAIALERTGQFDEAIVTMRKKLALLPKPNEEASMAHPESDDDDMDRILAAQHLPMLQREQYSACANLGTILVHHSMQKAISGDAQAKANVTEGLEYIHHAVIINPGSHFGRERWQAIAIESMLAFPEHPDFLLKFDLFGQPLASNETMSPDLPTYFPRSGRVDDAHTDRDQRRFLRKLLPTLQMADDWIAAVHPDYTKPMPFDEPTLAIIGMWTLGGGPNPHFALALGRIMQSIGQYQIAWEAYERAIDMQQQFWPDPTVQAKLVAICKTQQAQCAVAGKRDDPSGWPADMQSRHRAELAWGLAQQKAYQDYEAARIAAGVKLNDPHFYDAWFKNRPPIASPPGLADDLLVTDLKAKHLLDYVPCTVLGLGLGMLLALIVPERHLS